MSLQIAVQEQQRVQLIKFNSIDQSRIESHIRFDSNITGTIQTVWYDIDFIDSSYKTDGNLHVKYILISSIPTQSFPLSLPFQWKGLLRSHSHGNPMGPTGIPDSCGHLYFAPRVLVLVVGFIELTWTSASTHKNAPSTLIVLKSAIVVVGANDHY